MAACIRAPSSFIICLGALLYFSTFKHFLFAQDAPFKSTIPQRWFFGRKHEISWLSCDKNNPKYDGRRRFSRSRIRYYANSSATFGFDLVRLAGDVELNPGMTNNGTKAKRQPQQQQNIQIAHLNARSIKNGEHHIQTKDLVLKTEYDIFTVSETWLDSTVSDTEVEIPGYNIYRLDRLNKIGGGVCAFVRDGYKVEPMDDLSKISSTGLHQLWLKIQARNHKSFVVCTVYRPLDTTLNCFDEDLSGTLVSALPRNRHIF